MNSLLQMETFTPFSQKWTESASRKSIRNKADLNNIFNQLDTIDIYRLHPTTAEYTLFSCSHRTFTNTDHILDHKTNLNKFKRTGIRTSLVSSGQESACKCRGHGFDPWFKKIPQAVEQLSPCTTILSQHSRGREPQLLNSLNAAIEAHKPRTHPQQQERHCDKKAMHHKKESPPFSATRVSPCAVMKTQHSQK